MASLTTPAVSAPARHIFINDEAKGPGGEEDSDDEPQGDDQDGEEDDDDDDDDNEQVCHTHAPTAMQDMCLSKLPKGLPIADLHANAPVSSPGLPQLLLDMPNVLGQICSACTGRRQGDGSKVGP